MSWDKKFLIIGIIAFVTMVSFVVTDLSTRDKKKTVISYNSIHELFSIKCKTDSIDTVKNFVLYTNLNSDSIIYKTAVNTHIVFAQIGSDTMVYYMKNDGKITSKYLKDIYFRKDTTNKAYHMIKTALYDRELNNWYNPFTLNAYLSEIVLVLPSNEFDMIPKSLIKPEKF